MEILKHILEVLGGATIVIAAIATFFHNAIRDWLKQHWKTQGDLQLEEAKERGKVATVQPMHYVGDQYAVYVRLWKSLAGLQSAVNALWESASLSNALLLSERLKAANRNTMNWSLFFEDQHLQQLYAAFQTLESFHSGKTYLYHLRHDTELGNISESELKADIERQIQLNGDYKARFETLLAEIRQTFKRKIGARPDLDE